MSERNIVAFTGSRKLNAMQEEIVKSRLRKCSELGMYRAITGACVGVDELIALYLYSYFDVEQWIVVPADRKLVSERVLNLKGDKINFIFMPKKTTYRNRNEKMVELANVVDAFWTGKKAYSGTYMTINIAKRAEKLREVIRI